MKKQSVFNGLMVCILIVAMLPVSGPLAARAAPEATQGMKVTETTGLSTIPGEIQRRYQNGLSVPSDVSGAQTMTVTAVNSGEFSEVSTALTAVSDGSTAWGDYDNDGRLDILLTGNTGTTHIARVYHNNGDGTFTDIGAGLTWGSRGSAWGDYDNDGWLDILLIGDTGSTFIATVYHNNGDGTFTDIGAGLTGVSGRSASGDYDNDGWLDILLTGWTGSTYTAIVYHNNGNGTFTDIGAGLTGVIWESAAWGDYDNDGRLDILLTGLAGSGIAKVYHNNGDGTFTDINAGLTGVSHSSVAWGDYDNDGWLDILLTGDTGGFTTIAKVYHNNGNGTFTDIGAGLTGVELSSVAWGDYDNDGRLDILLTGYTGTIFIAKVYHNNGNGTFTDINAGLTGVYASSVAWGDYDNDGRLDILLTGRTTSTTYTAKVYHNNTPATNSVPVAPTGLRAAVAGATVNLLTLTDSVVSLGTRPSRPKPGDFVTSCHDRQSRSTCGQAIGKSRHSRHADHKARNYATRPNSERRIPPS